MDNVPPPPPGQPPYPPPGQPPYLPAPGPYPGYPNVPPPPQRGWFARNWLWFIPTGCLSVLAVFAVFVAVVAVFVFGAMKSSDPYKTALARAQASPQVAAALGTPVEDSFYLSGQINVSGDGGNANFSIPVSGPNAKGTLHVTGTKSGGVWDYSVMRVQVNGTPGSIDLLDPDR